MSALSSQAPLDDPRVEEAIQWMVLMQSGEMSKDEQRAFEHWHACDRRNMMAWDSLASALNPYGVAASDPAAAGALRRKTLGQQRSRRDMLAGLTGLIATGAVGMAATDRFVPVDHPFADYVTRTGQNRVLPSTDGLALNLAPRTAVNLTSLSDQRFLELVEGQVLATVSPAANRALVLDAGPFGIRTDAGSFVVERREPYLSVTVVEGKAQLRHAGADEIQIVRGDLIRVEHDRIVRQTADLSAATAWIEGLLIVNDRPVRYIVHALRPYFAGFIRLDPAVADLRVTGVFRLDRPVEALTSLSDFFEITVTQVAGYWVSVGSVRA